MAVMGRTSTPASRRPAPERGQSLVEFSLMLVVLVTLLMGVVDLGSAFFAYLALKDASAEGAYFGSVFPQCENSASVSGGRCGDPNNVDYRVRQSAPVGGLIDWSAATVTINAPNDNPGELITVTVSYNHSLITPVVGAIIGGQTFPLSATSVAVIVTDRLP